MKKRIFSLFMSLVMAISLVMVMPAAATDTLTSGDYEYIVHDDGTVGITKYNGSESELIIPSNIDEKQVTTIEGWSFEWNREITSIVLPDSLKSVENCAFWGCLDLESVVIPEGVTKIGDAAFHWCKLTEITLPNSVIEIGEGVFEGTYLTDIKIGKELQSIGRGAFDYCWYLKSIIVDEDNITYSSEDGILFSKNKTQLVHYPQGKENTSYIVPDYVTSIEDEAFYQSKYLTSIELPNGLISIGDEAFSQCVGLTSITIPNTVTSLGEYAFYNCIGTNSMIIPKNVVEIGNMAIGYIDGRPFEQVVNPDFLVCCYNGTAGHKYAAENFYMYMPYKLLDPQLEGTVYYQKKIDNTAVRFIAEVNIEDVTNTKSGNIKVTLNGEEVNVKVKNAYSSIVANGKKVEPKTGKCFIITPAIEINDDGGDIVSVEFTLDSCLGSLSRKI